MGTDNCELFTRTSSPGRRTLGLLVVGTFTWSTLLVGAGPAHAASTAVTVANDRLTIEAAPGKANRISVVLIGQGSSQEIRVSDAGDKVIAGEGCYTTGTVVQCNDNPLFATINLKDGDDWLSYNDDSITSINAGAGNDVVFGGAYSDDIVGGPGDDILDGRLAQDEIRGGLGNDTIYGGKNLTPGVRVGRDNDDLHGDEGNDTLYGQLGRDWLRGGEGQDGLSGGSGDDTLDAGPGNDGLNGGSGRDRMNGHEGNDRLYGVDDVAGNDALNGGSQDDLCVADTGDTKTNCEPWGSPVIEAPSS